MFFTAQIYASCTTVFTYLFDRFLLIRESDKNKIQGKVIDTQHEQG